MSTERELKKTGREVGAAAYTTGLNLAVLGVMLGASFMIQWAVWLVIVGVALHSLFSGASDAVGWMKAKLPANPMRKRDQERPDA